MEALKAHAPVLFSPKFWGLTMYIILGYLQVKGFLGGNEIEALKQIIGLATGVGVADSIARKIGTTK